MNNIKNKIDQFINKQKGKIALISLLSGLLVIGSVYFAFNKVYAKTVTLPITEQKTPQIAGIERICTTTEDIRTQVWCLLDEYGLTLEEKIKAAMIIECESKWNPNAFNSKTDDFGLWQINYYHHIKNGKTTITCAMDIECSTEYAVKLYREWGSWSAWTCSK